jgi:hypothetical protein
MNMADLQDALRRSKIRKVPWLDGPNMEFQIYTSEKMEKLFKDARNIGRIPEEFKTPKIMKV